MSKKKKPLVGQIFEKLEIVDATAEGKSVARQNERVIFVNGGVPGDIVDVKITLQKRRFLEGEPILFHQKSEHRTEHFCTHFGTCGGCKWQQMTYDKQLYYKQKQVKDNFERIGHLDFKEITPIFASEKTKFYRNKLEFTFSEKSWMTIDQLRNPEFKVRPALGFHVPGRFDKVMQIDQCFLQEDPSNEIRNTLFTYCMEKNIPFFNLRDQTGIMRNVLIRNSNQNEWMVIVVFAQEDVIMREELLNFLQQKFPSITSLFYVINNKKNDSLGDQEMIFYSGKKYITEKMEDLEFRVGPKSFFQTNSEQALNLYKFTRAFADLKGDELVYDLYTGTGTIANFVANYCKKVIGIEYIESAIEDAKINSDINKIENTLFFAGDMKDILNEEFIQTHGRPDVIITDPPRAGMHEDVVNAILKANPEKIVYVSCNPATQARDLAWMKDQYRIEKIQPVDMFPHTQHVENVVLLLRK